jgi:hypothetical protein
MSEQSVEGKVIHVLEIESGISNAGKDWSKKDFVIETDDQYPKKIAFTLFGDKVSLAPNIGEDVKVYYNLESREYNGKWFHNVNAWKIEKLGDAPKDEAQEEPSPDNNDTGLPF